MKDEKQTKAQVATLGQEMKNIQTKLQENRINAVEGNLRTLDPNQRRRQNSTRFCNYCRTNGHTPRWCRKKIRGEELKRTENESKADKKVTFTQDDNKIRGPGHGSEQWTRGQDFRRKSQNYTDDGPTKIFHTACQSFSLRPNFAYGNNNPKN